MGLKVIGAGFGRTGTNSLKIALETLESAPCHHMLEVFPREKQVNWFHDKAHGKSVPWDEVFEDFGSAVDWPSSAYYKELAEHYPESKVILSIRDPDKWYESAKETIYFVSTAIPKWLLLLSSKKRHVYEMIQQTIWQGVFDGKFEDREHAIEVFNNHIQEVRSVIPEDRLLIHEAKDGWEPLCEFLGKPIPEIPYPRVNEAGSFKKQIRKIKIMRNLPWVLLFFGSVFTAYQL